jgi:hypothetical protein
MSQKDKKPSRPLGTRKNQLDLGRKAGTARSCPTVDGFIGLLAARTKKVATIDEMNEAAARGWAGEK